MSVSPFVIRASIPLSIDLYKTHSDAKPNISPVAMKIELSMINGGGVNAPPRINKMLTPKQIQNAQLWSTAFLIKSLIFQFKFQTAVYTVIGRPTSLFSM